MCCDIFHSPFGCFSSTFRNIPLCDALDVLPFCSVVQATSCVPQTYAICPSPPMPCGVTTSLVIFVGGPSGGNQYSFNPFCPIRGLSPCGGNSTQSSVKRARTPSASPFNQPSWNFLCTRLIFAVSSADRLFPAPRATGFASKNTP